MSLLWIVTIGLKFFKLFAVLLEHLISQLSLCLTAALCTILVIILVFKLI